MSSIDAKGRLYIDNSTLVSVAQCSTKAVMRYGLGYTTTGGSGAAEVGTVIHNALERFHKGQPPSECIAAALPDYRSLVPDTDRDRLLWGNVRAILEAWFARFPTLEHLPYSTKPDLVEIGFAQPLDAEGMIILCGRIDVVGILRDNQKWYVIDHKTTYKVDSIWLSQFQMCSQMSGYVWAAQQQLSGQVAGAIINAIEVSILPTSTRRCSRHAVPYNECSPQHLKAQFDLASRSQAMLEEWRKSALHLARRFLDLMERFGRRDRVGKLRTQGVFCEGCRWCEFAPWCASGRKEEQIPALFEHKPWEPYDHAFPDRPEESEPEGE